MLTKGRSVLHPLHDLLLPFYIRAEDVFGLVVTRLSMVNPLLSNCASEDEVNLSTRFGIGRCSDTDAGRSNAMFDSLN